MYNRNPYFDQYFKQTVEPDETYYYYFYVMSYASLSKYLLYQSVAPFFNKHIIVCITDKRILVCEMNPLNGKLTGNTVEISLNDVKHLSLKKGFLKTKVKITFADDSAMLFSPNNFCIGLSNHKKHLIKLMEMYS